MGTMAGALRRKAFRRFVHLLTESGNPALLPLIPHRQEFALLARPCFHFASVLLAAPDLLPHHVAMKYLFFHLFNLCFRKVSGQFRSAPARFAASLAHGRAVPQQMPRRRIYDLRMILGILKTSPLWVAQCG